MKIAFVILVLLHGLIHLLGFVKGFGLKEVRELTLPVSRTMGAFWLATALLFLTYVFLYLVNSRYAWLIGFVAVVVSQILVFLFWKDARFGTIPNVIILAVSMVSFGYSNFQKRIQLETTALLNKNQGIPNRTVSERDLASLPEPVKKWLRNSGVPGKPFLACGRISQVAEMQMKPGQENWLAATAVQYTTIDNPGFVWSVDVRMNGLLNFQGRDKYEDGKGEMLIKMNSLFNVVDERGEKLDEGTLQRFLGEMVWFPSLALSPYLTWEQVDENTAKATMQYKGTSGSGTFYFNPSGEITKFSALRYKGNEPDAKRYEWEVNCLDYKTFEGIRVPAHITSTWKLDNQNWTWLKMEVTDIRYNHNL